MLEKEECIAAIKRWKDHVKRYEAIQDLIDPLKLFSFNREQINWLRSNNEFDFFHVYMGVLDKQMIIIVVPLDKNGKEKHLKSYVINKLQKMDAGGFRLVEEETTIKSRVAHFSQDLILSDYSEYIELSTVVEPIISLNTAIQEIEAWKNQCRDWFYKECDCEEAGSNVFKAFNVPYTDLSGIGLGIDKVLCLFAFKYSELYGRDIPTLIFIKTDTESQLSRLIQSTEQSNVYDWSQPCPPFCKDKLKFELLQ